MTRALGVFVAAVGAASIAALSVTGDAAKIGRAPGDLVDAARAAVDWVRDRVAERSDAIATTPGRSAPAVRAAADERGSTVAALPPIAPPSLVQTRTIGDRAVAAPTRGARSLEPRDDADSPPPFEDVLVSTAKETIVYARPSTKAPKLGYLRAGAVVSRDPEPASYDGCRGGFYGVAPEGFVCVGPNASIDAHGDAARTVPRRADRTTPLPYVYGVAPLGGAPAYSRIPTDDERRNAEASLHVYRGDEKSFDGVPLDPIPWFLTEGAPSIAPNGIRFSRTQLLVGTPSPKSGFAFTSLFELDGRRFALTVDMTIVPLDRVTKVEPSRFHGLPLSEDGSLPVVFVRSKSAALYSGDPARAGLKFQRRLEFREAVPITGKTARASDVAYLETRDGGWIVDKDLVRVNADATPPPWAAGSRTWVDVSISKQTLVAYEGPRPVFVTLVSTGVDGAGDPETTHSTIQGQFLIHTKHVTTTMDGDEAGDEFDLREVPYVQYFKDGFALHAAYWHDAFGVPRSHGCVNLSPLDARWLFAWTEPHVPATWHGAMSARGTLVRVRE